MFKVSDLVVAGVATTVLTLGFAAAQARDVKPPVVVPAVVAEASSAAQDRTDAGQATAEKIVEAGPCAKKIKVVYAGYGEADRACATR